VAPSTEPLTPPARTVLDRSRSGTVPFWALRLTAIATVLNVFFLGLGYARANVKADAAPLQPPVVTTATQATTRPAATPAVTLRRGLRTTPSAPLTTTRHS